MSSSDNAMVGPVAFERLEHDSYYTVDDRCLPALMNTLYIPNEGVDWECACGSGHLSRGLTLDFDRQVYSSDVKNDGYNAQNLVKNFFCFKVPPLDGIRRIITNPPYDRKIVTDFVEHAIELMRLVPGGGQVYMLMRNEWDCAKSRRHLFADHPAYAGKVVLNFRPKWIEGEQKASPRHNYCWYVWDWSKDPAARPFILYALAS